MSSVSTAARLRARTCATRSIRRSSTERLTTRAGERRTSCTSRRRDGCLAWGGRDMLDIKLIRDRLDFVKEKLALVGSSPGEVQLVYDLDEERRKLLAEVESLRAARNRASKDIGSMPEGASRDLA